MSPGKGSERRQVCDPWRSPGEALGSGEVSAPLYVLP